MLIFEIPSSEIAGNDRYLMKLAHLHRDSSAELQQASSAITNNGAYLHALSPKEFQTIRIKLVGLMFYVFPIQDCACSCIPEHHYTAGPPEAQPIH